MEGVHVMKIHKIIISSIITLILLFSLSIPSFAASGINANEQRIINKVQEGLLINGSIYYPLKGYTQDVINYFNRSNVNVTKKEADNAITSIEDAYSLKNNKECTDILGKQSKFDLNDLPYKYKKQILDDGIAACASVGLVLTYNKSTGNVVIHDKTGKCIFDYRPVIIKQTGSVDMTSTYIGLGALTVVVAAGVVLSVKFKLLRFREEN
ncbi:hypothetical protein SDC9_126004 [bioreactor metagenome]|uniref:Uncharacterized protein n=1 Tax=bioreactor metagenome TaxID=1076179 RepID=A0A645CQ08_9ZZZZ